MSADRQGEPLEGIAVVGMAGRFPGAAGVDALWQNVREGRESITRFSKEQLLAAGVPTAALADARYVRAKGVIDAPELFDAAFFGMTPREAAITDPQHRLFLECAWEALEHAGYTPDGHELTVGVYAGSGGMSTYFLQNLHGDAAGVDIVEAYQYFIANEKDFLPTRVAFKLNLKGPAVAVQTACSTSLVAISAACQALMSYQCDLALAGAAAVSFPHVTGYWHREGMILSPDGRCRTFDAAARGTVPGSGVGVVALRRLEDAIADGDCIHAVIRGWAVNNDGAARTGYTAPGVDGQAEVIAAAQALAGVSPETIGYVEAHGTGTPLGDPIEVAALTRAFRAETQERAFCALGSLKTNLGHLDVAAGVAGLLKVIMALKHRMIPPSLHFERPNPDIDFASSPFYVNTRLSAWESERHPRRAGVSSFGIGGTNAHVVLEEAPEIAPRAASAAPQLVVLSARSPAALDAATARLAEHLSRHGDLDLGDVAWTLQLGRKAFRVRRALVCDGAADAAGALVARDPKRVTTGEAGGRERRVAFMFSGQGAQYAGMGAGLYEGHQVFRRCLDACAEGLRPALGLDLRKILSPADAGAEAAARLDDTSLTQPALFSVEYALARQWMEWGVTPHGMIGHSVGEYVAACLAGVMSLEDALRLVAARGRLMQRLPRGSMLAVPCAESEVRALLGDALSLAAVNGPSLCVVAGPTRAVAELAERLASRGVKAALLRTSHAFHSEMMAPAIEPFADEVRKIALKAPSMPYVSTVTGTWITAEEACDPRYWARQIQSTVRFSDGLATLLGDRELALLEVGPGRTLSTAARRHPDSGDARLTISSLRHPEDPPRDASVLLGAVGRLWSAGVPIDFRALQRGAERRRVPLPTYPFERQRCWVDPPARAGAQRPSATARKIQEVDRWFYLPLWKQTAPPRPADAPSGASRWLIFEDGCGVGRALGARLRAEGHAVTPVSAGTSFSRRDDGGYVIDPARAGDYAALFAALAAPPDGIAHLFGVTRDEERSFEQIQREGLYSALALIQALPRGASGAAVGLWFVTDRMQRVAGEAERNPAKATLLAACNGVSQEMPHVRCASVDIEARPDPDVVEQLRRELSRPPQDKVVAYRGGRRWVQGFEPAPPGPPIERAPALSTRGTWLITGGLGGIGLALAEHLARVAQPNLVLLGRTPMPSSSEWDRWLMTHGADDRVSRVIHRLKAIRSLGSEVVLETADVTDEARVREVVMRARDRSGGIEGVIHAAGVLDESAFRAIKDTDPALCEAHFRPKVAGLVALAGALRGAPPRIGVLMSSLSSVLGGLGMVAYAAANLFMDAFADASGSPWVTLNWDGWSLPDTRARPTSAAMAELAMTPAEGVQAFERALTLSGSRQVVISTGDLQARLDRWVRRTEPASDAPSQVAAHPRPALSAAYLEPSDERERVIARVFGEAIGLRQVGRHDDFFELGGDSLLAVHVLSRLREALGVELSPQALLRSPTVAALAQAVVQQGSDALAGAGKASSPLVEIQSGGDRTPLFLVHPVGGHVFFYRDLGRHLGPEQPVYALEALGLDGVTEPLTRVEDMARVYLESLMARQSEGPYLLGGASFGGTVAFEMAQQLLARGERVALLALLDTPGGADLPDAFEADDAAILSYLLGIGAGDALTPQALRELDPDERLRKVLDRAEALRIPPGMGMVELRRSLVVFKANVQAMRRYSPRPCAARIHFFRAMERDSINPHHPEAAWTGLAELGMEVVEVPGNHLTMNQPPHVRALAERLRACLAAATGEESGDGVR